MPTSDRERPDDTTTAGTGPRAAFIPPEWPSLSGRASSSVPGPHAHLPSHPPRRNRPRRPVRRPRPGGGAVARAHRRRRQAGGEHPSAGRTHLRDRDPEGRDLDRPARGRGHAVRVLRLQLPVVPGGGARPDRAARRGARPARRPRPQPDPVAAIGAGRQGGPRGPAPGGSAAAFALYGRLLGQPGRIDGPRALDAAAASATTGPRSRPTRMPRRSAAPCGRRCGSPPASASRHPVLTSSAPPASSGIRDGAASPPSWPPPASAARSSARVDGKGAPSRLTFATLRDQNSPRSQA